MYSRWVVYGVAGLQRFFQRPRRMQAVLMVYCIWQGVTMVVVHQPNCKYSTQQQEAGATELVCFLRYIVERQVFLTAGFMLQVDGIILQVVFLKPIYNTTIQVPIHGQRQLPCQFVTVAQCLRL